MIVTISFWIALIFGLVLVPLARNYSLRLGIVDTPKGDRWHSRPTPKVGGIAIFIAFAISISSTILITSSFDFQWALLVGSVITFIVGIIDDNRSLSPVAKIVGQIIAAAIVVFFIGLDLGFKGNNRSGDIIGHDRNLLSDCRQPLLVVDRVLSGVLILSERTRRGSPRGVASFAF